MRTFVALAAITALLAVPHGAAAGGCALADPAAPSPPAERCGDRDLRLDLAFGMVVTRVPPVRVDEVVLGWPAVVGLHLGYYPREWLGLEVSGDYQFDIHRWHLLAGPRLRLRRAPLSVAAGLQAGIMTFDSRWVGEFDARRMQFGLSPEAGVELELGSHLLVGVRYAFDVPARAHPVLGHRIMLTEGGRF